jgi:apolipoprotein N-acyltransferase
MLVLSFPPFDLWYLAWIALVPLMYSISCGRRLEALLNGLLAGFIYFLGTVYWVSHSMYIYGNVPIPLTIIAVILLCLYLCLYTGLFSYLFGMIQEGLSLPASLIAPPLWVSLELIRTYALTGFPWSSLGYSQHPALSIIQISDITGIYGVSFLVVAINGLVFDLTAHLTGRDRSTFRLKAFGVTFVLLISALSLFYGTFRLYQPEADDSVRVSVIQGNIPQDQKWDRRFQGAVMGKYISLTMQAMNRKPQLVVWPETALPFVFGYDGKLTEKLRQFQKRLGAYLLTGSVRLRDERDGERKLSNSVILLSPDGEVASVYDKIHLVPYGEYVPLRSIFPFIEKLVEAIGDFLPGREIVVMETPFARIGNLICYEIIFPGLVRKFVHDGADLLVTVTNDAWFGRTSAPYQHFSMAVFRAVENRVPVVRAANTGISGFIDSRGRVIEKSDIFVQAVLTHDLKKGTGGSFYSDYGDVFAYICLLVSFAMIASRPVMGKKG